MTKGLIIGGLIGAAAVSFLVGASLSWLFILACPLMMVFMHGGHHHGGHSDKANHKPTDGEVSSGDGHLAHPR
jgi:hypothetical protein